MEDFRKHKQGIKDTKFKVNKFHDSLEDHGER